MRMIGLNNILEKDKKRYEGKIPIFQVLYRKSQTTKYLPLKLIYKILFRFFRERKHIELSSDTKIGEGLYIGHPYAIIINPQSVIGKNCNIHKGVLIGQENRGKRKGTPIIGDNVWIGINSAIIGAVHIGNDVLIAPNSYVNCDVPDHSVVIGNPCVIKHRDNATEGYINRIV